MLHHLLILRLSLVTIAGAALSIWAHANGLVLPIFASDVSFLSYAIVALFSVGLASTFIRAAKVSAAINNHKAHGYANSWCRRKASKMADKAAHIDDIAGWLQILGLLGTVIGFYVALGGQQISDAEAVVTGVRTAIGTTIVGGFLSLWTSINFRILDTATAGYMEDVRWSAINFAGYAL